MELAFDNKKKSKNINQHLDKINLLSNTKLN